MNGKPLPKALLLARRLVAERGTGGLAAMRFVEHVGAAATQQAGFRRLGKRIPLVWPAGDIG